jgi:hypothetical protein
VTSAHIFGTTPLRKSLGLQDDLCRISLGTTHLSYPEHLKIAHRNRAFQSLIIHLADFF